VRAPIDVCVDVSSPCGDLAAQRSDARAAKHGSGQQVDRGLANAGF
jgi:hypothetical protein